MNKTIKYILALTIPFISLNAQSLRSLNNDGVDLYKNKKYTDAEVNFKKGIDKDTNSFHPRFNLGDSYFKQGKYEEAVKAFGNSAAKAMTKEEQAKSFYNMGSSFVKAEKYKEAIDAFKKSLKLNPKDKDAKYNLSYAIEKEKEQQKQNQNQNKNNQNKDDKKNNKDQNKDQNKDNKDNKDKKDNKDQNKNNDNKDNKDQNKKDQDKQNQQQKQNEPKMSKPEAERILEAIKNNEKDLQKQLRKKAGTPVKTDKDW